MANPEVTKSATDLAEHTRTVHLSLAAICLVLAVGVLQEPARPTEKALSDALAIRKLKDAAPDVSIALISEIQKRLAAFVHDPRYDRPDVRQKLRLTWPDGLTSTVHLVHPAWLYITDSVNKQAVRTADRLPDFRCRSLAEFVTFWDHNIAEWGTSQVILVPLETNTLRAYRGGQRAKEVIAIAAGSDSPDDEDLVFRADLSEEHLTLSWTSESLEVRGTYVLKELDRIPVSFQDVVRKFAGKENVWPLGQFDSSFSELKEKTKNLRSLDLEALVEELKDRANREREKVDLFGAKIPSNTVASVGLAILVGCQMYFFILLGNLRSSGATAGDEYRSAWIGLFEGRAALWFTVLSASILPGVVAALVSCTVIRQIDSTWSRLLSTAGTVVAFSLSGMTLMGILRAREKSPQSDEAPGRSERVGD